MRTTHPSDLERAIALLALNAALACSAGATQYADDDDGVASPAAELGAGVPPGLSVTPSNPGAAANAPPGDGLPASADATPLPLPPPSGEGAGATPPAAPPAEGAPNLAPPEVANTGEVASDSCSLSVSVTTVSPGGRYAPRNVGAIWIADAEDRFVKSLHVWGDRRLRHVEAWNAATEAAGAAGNVVDAVTGATEPSHAARSGTWNCRDFNAQPVPDGKYRVYFEVTESNGAGPTTFANFEKGAVAQSVQTAAPNFENMSLTFTP